jgi:RNA polymerase sigma-70 factor (ECF subfamily)
MAEHRSPTDPEKTSLSLLERAKSDDQDAWRRIVRLYGPLVYNWCSRAGLSESDVADVFQDVFRAVSSGIGRFNSQAESGSFRGWLRTIVRSKVADHFQRIGKQPQAKGGTEAGARIAEIPDPMADDSVVEQENDRTLIVRRAMELIEGEFKPKNWQAFQRVAIKGEATSDVARDLGMTEQAIRQVNYRVRRRLRVELEGLVDQ